MKTKTHKQTKKRKKNKCCYIPDRYSNIRYNFPPV